MKNIFFINLLLITAVFCQSWKINTTNKSIVINKLLLVQNDSLIVIKSGNQIQLPIENIKSIKKIPNIGFGVIGCGLGSLLGLSVAMKIGTTMVDDYTVYSNQGMVIGAISGIIIFPKLFGKRFELKELSVEQKVKKINKLIEIYEN